MAKYLKRFNNHTEYEEFTATTEFVLPNVSSCVQEGEVHYNPLPPHYYSQDYLTIESLEDNNTIGWKASGSSIRKTINVSTDGGQTWTNKTSSTSGTALATLNNGDKLLIKGSNTAYGTSDYYNYFTATQNFDVEGNIMSLLYGDNFIGETSLSGKDYVFKNLFYENTYLINAQNLILPATILAYQCYRAMFMGCSSLITAPVLSATTLAEACYRALFSGCKSLTTAPALPATTLADSCYYNIFYDCASLTTAPELPATTLANYCYQYMFYGCSSLTTAPELPATTLTSYCYYYMFKGCSSLTTALELPATTLTEYCYSNMFDGCTSLTTTPELPATTLADYCYLRMFKDCTSLTIAPELPATTLTEYCYSNMFERCTALTTAPELPATGTITGCYSNMFYGCSSLNYIKCLATNVSTYSTDNWLKGVASSGTFVKNKNMNSWKTNTGMINTGIPSGWTVEDAA